MTTLEHMKFAGLPAVDLYGRLSHLQEVIESHIKDIVDIPEDVNFKAALILARMATNPEVQVRPSDLGRMGYYSGSNVNYNLNHLISRGYVTTSPGMDKRVKWIRLTEVGKVLGVDIAMQLSFIEQQIGGLFSKEEHKRGVDFLGKTVFGDERPRASNEVKVRRKQTA